MNAELKAYFSIEAKIAAAFNFFINGMISALIHHAADAVPVDVISLAIELTSTCVLTFIITAYFVRAGLKSTKTVAILPPANKFVRLLTQMYNVSGGDVTPAKKGIVYPLRFGVPMGLFAAVVFFIIIAPLFTLLEKSVLPFFTFVLGKSFFCMLFGAGVTVLEMYVGMCKAA